MERAKGILSACLQDVGSGTSTNTPAPASASASASDSISQETVDTIKGLILKGALLNDGDVHAGAEMLLAQAKLEVLGETLAAERKQHEAEMNQVSQPITMSTADSSTHHQPKTTHIAAAIAIAVTRCVKSARPLNAWHPSVA